MIDEMAFSNDESFDSNLNVKRASAFPLGSANSQPSIWCREQPANWVPVLRGRSRSGYVTQQTTRTTRAERLKREARIARRRAELGLLQLGGRKSCENASAKFWDV